MKIFIAIASYQDKMLDLTLRSAYNKAQNKDNLVFGVVDQSNIPFADYPFAKQVRYVRIDPIHARGPCWARALAQSLMSDETYFLQIDSHTVFGEGWDIFLIKNLERLQQVHAKPLISHYPLGFKLLDYDAATFEVVGEYPDGLNPMRVKSDELLSAEYTVAQHGVMTESVDPQHGFLLGGGFIFAPSAWVQEVPYDPHFYFHGEEQALMLRTFTHGFSLFHIAAVPLYHLYYDHSQEERRPLHWDKQEDQQREISWGVLKDNAVKRFEDMLAGHLPIQYCLGVERDLEDYVLLSGICFESGRIIDVDKAERGTFVQQMHWRVSLDQELIRLKAALV